jgi:arginine decarboxylase
MPTDPRELRDEAPLRAVLTQHPDARAVFVGDPSYVGTIGDVAGLADVAHQHDVPLVVDAAWAAHFGFHPALPRHALQLGADVMVTSAHKPLPSYSQATLLLARTERVDPAGLDAGFEATATTSPAGSILAAIDAARALLERDGETLIGDVIDAGRAARERLLDVDGLLVLDGPGVDPLKLVLVLVGTGADGNAIERDLIAAGMPVESADRDVLIAIVSIADTRRTVDALVSGVADSIERHRGAPRPIVGAAS